MRNQAAPSSRVRYVESFEALANTVFAEGVNALCWPRELPGDFAEVVAKLGDGDEIETLDETRLRSLPLSAAGQLAVDALLADLQRLRDRQLDPVLNCIRGYPPDDSAGPIPTDVFSFHADSAPIAADTWLCTYYGSPSEAVPNEQARRRIDDPAIRAELLREFGGADDDSFREFLREQCYDLHYAAASDARPFSFGHFNLWRIAIEYPESPVPPCIHRAPATIPGQPRLLLIS